MTFAQGATTAVSQSQSDLKLRASSIGRAAAPSFWRGRRVTVMGLGCHGGGIGAVRYLVRHGACVTVSDAANRHALAESLAQLSGLPRLTLKLGGHDPADFADAQSVVVNPAVRPDHACLEIARRAGTALTSEIELFLQACPATVIGVTGSNGKSTTSAMLAAILTAAGRRTRLGGNFGGSLLDDVEHMTAQDWVVLELSSFQLAHLGDRAPLPRFAVVTNCTPNHLDWHGDFDDYRRAKWRLVTGQPAESVAILPSYDAEVRSWSALAVGEVRDAWPLERLGHLTVPGDHNRHNAACAAAAAEAAGVSPGLISSSLAHFRGLDHRLEFVGELAGRRFYNDSKSTTSEATLAALAALGNRVWLLAGGQSKGGGFDALAHAIVERTLGAGLFGASREALRAAVVSRRADFELHVAEQLADALAWCWRRSRPGDCILLSPACASHDQFPDFAARGQAFNKGVRNLFWQLDDS